MVLDPEEIFFKNNFPSLFQTSLSKYHDYSVSEVFLKFAKDYFTNGKADPPHYPKYGNSLIRIPNTYNSKCLDRGLSREESRVKIIQKWDGKRLPIQYLLKGFRRWIVQEEINENKKQIKKSKSKRSSFDKFNQKGGRIKWIETLLQTPIDDYRKQSINLILSPYLINVKKISYHDSYNILTEWLSNCNMVKSLDFNPNYMIKWSLNTAISKGIPPMRLDTLKNKNVLLHHIVTK